MGAVADSGKRILTLVVAAAILAPIGVAVSLIGRKVVLPGEEHKNPGIVNPEGAPSAKPTKTKKGAAKESAKPSPTPEAKQQPPKESGPSKKPCDPPSPGRVEGKWRCVFDANSNGTIEPGEGADVTVDHRGNNYKINGEFSIRDFGSDAATFQTTNSNVDIEVANKDGVVGVSTITYEGSNDQALGRLSPSPDETNLVLGRINANLEAQGSRQRLVTKDSQQPAAPARGEGMAVALFAAGALGTRRRRRKPGRGVDMLVNHTRGNETESRFAAVNEIVTTTSLHPLGMEHLSSRRPQPTREFAYAPERQLPAMARR